MGLKILIDDYDYGRCSLQITMILQERIGTWNVLQAGYADFHLDRTGHMSCHMLQGSDIARLS